MAAVDQYEVAKKMYEQTGSDFYKKQMEKYAPTTTTKPSTPTTTAPTVSSNVNTASSSASTKVNDLVNRMANTVSSATPTKATTSASVTNPVGVQAAQQIQAQTQPVQQPVNTDLMNQITELTNVIKGMNQPQQVPEYKNPANDKILELLSQYQNRPQFEFNADNNPTVNALQDQINKSITDDMARRNMLFSGFTGEQIADKTAEQLALVLPQLQNQAFNQYQAQGDDMLQQISLLSGLEGKDYDRYMNALNTNRTMQNDYRNNILDTLGILQGLEGTRYNREQAADDRAYQKQQDAITNNMNTAQLTGYYNPYAGVQISPEVEQYANDYQAEINRRRATPDTNDDYLIPQLEAARANKVFSSPELLSQYGDQYKTIAQKQRDLENELAILEYEASMNPNSPENARKILELQKLQTEIDMLTNYGPREQELKLQEIQSRIDENKAQAAKARSDSSKSSSGYTFNDYIKIGLDMKNKGNNNAIRNEYGDIIGNEYKPVYDDDQLYDWVVGLYGNGSLDDNEMMEMLNILNISDVPNKKIAEQKRKILFK